MLATLLYDMRSGRMVTDVKTLAARILADASDVRIDDATFRRRAMRLARTVQRETQQSAQARAARYVFVAVPRGDGGTASISIAVDTFEELAGALGGRREVAAAARKLAAGYKPESGLSRTNYVRRRLQQLAARKAQAPARRTARAGTAERG